MPGCTCGRSGRSGRRGIDRLSRERWGTGQSIWGDDVGDRELSVEVVEIRETAAPPSVAAVRGTEQVWVRRRRFVLDGKPVLLSACYLPAGWVAGSAITEEDTGPGGTYARLAELGHAPVRFREEIRSRMPTADEAGRLRLPAGTPVVLVGRTAFTADGQAVEVNEMVLDSSRTSWSTASRS